MSHSGNEAYICLAFIVLLHELGRTRRIGKEIKFEMKK
jgi:hypothetical protein